MRVPVPAFDRVADNYDRARPRYPEKLFDDLVELTGIGPDSRLLEVGCGTGIATLPMAERGFRITCVEMGENLAAVARRKLAPYPNVSVTTSRFEDWDAIGEKFDLLYCAQVWHWLDPEVRYQKAADVLRPGAFLAIVNAEHAFPEDADPFFFEIQDVYRAIGEGHPDEAWPPPLPGEVPDMREEMDASGLFRDVRSRRYVWELMYTADEYIDLLNSFSGHIAMEPEKRALLYDSIRKRIGERADRRVRRDWLAILNVARRVVQQL